MKIDFGGNEYIGIKVVENGTAGIPYDCRLEVELKTELFSGFSDAWIDGEELVSFIEELKELDKTLKGKATLNSSSPGELFIEVKPADSLGHFVLNIELGKTYYIYGNAFHAKTAYSFGLDSQSISRVCGYTTNYFDEAFNA